MNIDDDFYTQNVRALLVDDFPSNLFVVEDILRKYGIEVVTAVSGEDSIDKIQAGEFDVVFMDYMMPGMSGIDAAKAIRAMGGKYKLIPIVAFSSVDDEFVKAAFLEAGMNAFLSKPIIVSQLHSVLSEVLPAGKMVSPQSTRYRNPACTLYQIRG